MKHSKEKEINGVMQRQEESEKRNNLVRKLQLFGKDPQSSGPWLHFILLICLD